MFLSPTRYSSRKRRTHGPNSSCLSINHLPDIAFESERCFDQQLRGHGQVHLSACKISVAEMGRKSGQQTLNVQPVPIPSDHAMHAKGVTQVVNPGLLSTRVRTDTGLLAKASK